MAPLEAFDIVLTPMFGTAACRISTSRASSGARWRVDGADTPYAGQGAWSAFASFAGLPATVAPVARNAEGLPIGVQIVGPYLHDRTTLAVAEWLEAQRG
jgi:amidase